MSGEYTGVKLFTEELLFSVSQQLREKRALS